MDEFTRDGDEFAVSIPLDSQRMLGRECPNADCLGYFKIEPGTGLAGEDLQCTCPYCGHTDPPDHFWTPEQIEYAQSVALREYLKDFDSMFKSLERKPTPGAWFSIGIKVETTPYPIARYAEKDLETELVCQSCTLRYAIYGVFGYCPDCGTHNSLQILRANLQVAAKMVEMALAMSDPMRRAMLENALQAAVASFDAFGRQLCRTYANRASNPKAASAISFQSITRAAEQVSAHFGVDIAAAVGSGQWRQIEIQFQKRHLLAHAAGVVDTTYIKVTGDSSVELGRKVVIDPDEILRLLDALEVCARRLHSELSISAS